MRKRSEMNKARERAHRAFVSNKQKGPFENPRAILRRSIFFVFFFVLYVKSGGGRHIRSEAPEEENYYFNVPNRFVLL